MNKNQQQKIRLNRLFLLGNAEYRRTFLIVLVMFVLLPVILLICFGALAWWNVLLLVLLDAVICVGVALKYPRTLWFRGGTLEFEENFVSGRSSAIRAMVTLTDLRDVRFVQNAVERRFGVARLCLTATPQVEYTGALREDLPRYSKTHYVFCGIRLAETRSLLEAELPDKAFRK